MVKTWTHGIDRDSWYGHGSWYRHELMVLTTSMVLTQTHGIESVLLYHTCTRGPSVTCMRDFLKFYLIFGVISLRHLMLSRRLIYYHHVTSTETNLTIKKSVYETKKVI